MKTIKIILIGLILVGSQFAKAQGKTPEDAINKYNSSSLELLKTGSSKELQAVSSKEVYELNKMSLDMMKGMGADIPKTMPEFGEVTCETKGTTSTCNCKLKGTSREEQLMLTKTSKGWIVNGVKGKVITQEDVDQTKAMLKAMGEMNK